MEYMTKKRYKKRGINRDWNLPYGTPCGTRGRYITCDGAPVCVVTSQDAYDYFVRDDDGQGARRAELIQDIKDTLEHRDDEYQTRWDRVWGAPELARFKRKEHRDFWLWNHDFYNAEIKDLEHIKAVIGGECECIES